MYPTNQVGYKIAIAQWPWGLLNPIVHFWLYHSAHCAEKIVSALAHWFCISRKGGWGHPQGAVHMVAARLGFEKAMVGTGLATLPPDCMDRLRKHYSHCAEGWSLARKAAWSLSGCMATDSADYYVLVNEWVWSISQDCLLRLEVNMGSDLESELGQKWR